MRLDEFRCHGQSEVVETVDVSLSLKGSFSGWNYDKICTVSSETVNYLLKHRGNHIFRAMYF